MSVSLAMIPVAIALRIMMGEESFNQFVESSQIKIPVGVKNSSELIKLVKKSGFDIKRFGQSYKSHYNGKNNYFFWDLIDGVWNICLDRSIPKQDIDRILNDISQGFGRKISADINIQKNIRTFPTIFTDEKMLLNTLKKIGLEYMVEDNGILVNTVETQLEFIKNSTGFYSVTVKDETKLPEIYKSLTDIMRIYKEKVQQHTYNNVIEKLDKQNYKIENEERLEDNTIILTVSVD
ncbi:MAG: hypothetical protein M0P94_04150 [Candidatus Absconditabacterales bacterium]|nr:hypothetical protein [Candidatus Absconditabacterales bacterium]